MGSDYRAMLSEVPSPILLLQSADDLAVPAAVGRYMIQALPHATLCQIEAYGHLPQLSAPDAVNAAIRAYLDSQRQRVWDYSSPSADGILSSIICFSCASMYGLAST